MSKAPETTVAVYLRVSTEKQEHASQKRAVDDFLSGRKLTATEYTDKASGATLSRSGLDRLQRDIFNGKVRHVVFYSLDRFSRELVNGLVQIEAWQKQGVRLTFVADSLDLDGGFLSDVAMRIIVAVKLAFGEHERARIKERQALGIANAKANGTRSGKPFGAPAKLTPEAVQETLKRCKGDKRKAAKRLHVSLATVYNTLNRPEKGQGEAQRIAV